MSQTFYNICIQGNLQRLYHVTEAVMGPAVIGNIAVVGALTLCALLSVYVKATQIIGQRIWIRKLNFYQFKLSDVFPEAIKTFDAGKIKRQLFTEQQLDSSKM